MTLRRTLRNAVVAALVTGIVATPLSGASAAPAGGQPVHDQQIENTLKSLMRDAEKGGGGKVTVESLTRAIDEKKTTNSWERDVDFEVTGSYSSEFGKFSLAAGPDGAVGMATRSADGGCTMTMYKDGKTTTWSIGDVGKNCTGESALGGKDGDIKYADPIPPGPVTGLVATPGDSVVELTWTGPGDTDLAGYQILVDGIVVTSVPAGTTSYRVTGLTNYTEYRFQVKAVDEAENIGYPSDEETATPIDLTPPAVPVSIDVAAGESSLHVAWAPNTETDLAGYRIYIDGELYAEVPAGTEALDVTGLVNYQEYRVEVAAYDVNGNESNRSETVTGTPIDMTAPAVPLDITVTPGDTQITIGWAPNTEADLAGYNVYQDGVLVATIPAGTTSTTITGLTNYQPYGFSVTAYDTNGNESNESAPVTGTPIDLTPPAVPTGMKGEPKDGAVNLSWDANTEADLSHYLVYRDGVVVAKIQAPTTTATISGLQNGTGYGFSVSAVDKNGNESARSTATTVAPTTQGPNAPTGLVVALVEGSSPQQIRATWAGVAGATGYTVQRSTDNGVTWTTLPTTTATTYTDTPTPLLTGRYYYYRVATIAGNATGAYSGKVGVLIPSPPPVVNYLTTESSTTKTTLYVSWPRVSAPAGTSVTYRVQIATVSGSWGNGYTSGATIFTSSPSYSLSGLTAGATRYVRVAVAYNGVVGGWSRGFSTGTLPPDVTSLRRVNDYRGVTLSWGWQPQQHTFEIYRNGSWIGTSYGGSFEDRWAGPSDSYRVVPSRWYESGMLYNYSGAASI